MCGIIGIVGTEPVAARLIDSLKRLEYRGYDSAGIAVVDEAGLGRRRAAGKISGLEAVLTDEPLRGRTGIGHTRWATHGAPTTRNAHPHVAGRVAVVHNGIIENFAELKRELIAAGRTFESDTDSEVVAQLIDAEMGAGLEPLAALKAALDRLEGAFAVAVLIKGDDDLVMGARRGPPLVVGYGDGEMYIGTDAMAVGPFTQRIAYLDEGDCVAIDHAGARIFDASGAPVQRPIVTVPASAALVEKGNYRHFMEKEIHDQPDAVQHTLSSYIDPIGGHAAAPGGFDFTSIDRLQIVACGTASYAGMIGRYLFERLADLPCDVEFPSEFRYREPAVTPKTLAVGISQSGETADTLAALRWCKAKGLQTAAIVNSHGSTMAREVDIFWPTNAGPEVAVASTKAFTAQVSALTALAIAAAVQRGRIDAAEEARLVAILMEAPRLLAEAVFYEEVIHALAFDIAKARDVLYFGRGAMYPLALEGALKLKEISYIHAEGYAAGELKHGPIALVDEYTPIIVIAPSDELFDKTASNMSEVIARGGKVIMITDQEGATRAPEAARLIIAPTCDPLIAPLVLAAPIQLLAYHVAVQKGADVDQPRNLAKSVTVE
ncbi:MAG TPA: glutamine--fructose-6-phosphate transaminase (isomerizing) [Caulobacteraceae bacterium]|jgi:glucosamine--fructose-6-phosphate aminotransferase (isomerizing)|nr:glutamine--fructose-6-phosphate transaminase (isomerizing) [Caulobacteraceae bacterium]